MSTYFIKYYKVNYVRPEAKWSNYEQADYFI